MRSRWKSLGVELSVEVNFPSTNLPTFSCAHPTCGAERYMQARLCIESWWPRAEALRKISSALSQSRGPPLWGEAGKHQLELALRMGQYR